MHADPWSPRQVLVTRFEDLQTFGLAPGELRENLVLGGLSEALFASGNCLQIGPEAALRLTFHCEPCAQIADRVSLKAIVKRRGMLAVVVHSGLVQVGDPVVVTPRAYAPVSDLPVQRCVQALRQVPAGRVATSVQILRVMGVQTSYARALPGYLRQAPPGTPLHRLVDVRGRLLEAHLPEQARLLAAEGVALTQGQVSLAHYGWQPSALYLS
ncbi:MAG: MOSC domain-containing protein [Candidatus Sericytochromatia bacterium]